MPGSSKKRDRISIPERCRESLLSLQEQFHELGLKHPDLSLAVVISSDWIPPSESTHPELAGVHPNEWKTILGVRWLAGPCFFRVGDECLQGVFYDQVRGVREPAREIFLKFHEMAKQAVPRVRELSPILGLSITYPPGFSQEDWLLWCGFLYDRARRYDRSDFRAPRQPGPRAYQHAKLSPGVFQASAMAISLLLEEVDVQSGTTRLPGRGNPGGPPNDLLAGFVLGLKELQPNVQWKDIYDRCNRRFPEVPRNSDSLKRVVSRRLKQLGDKGIIKKGTE
jgi:hypothetical protein